VLAFFGAGVWGFMHTLHPVNYYTHGTQVTAAHGHLAFFGAYVIAEPRDHDLRLPVDLQGPRPYNQVLNMARFWLMSSAMAFMTFVLTFAGAVQTHLQRVMGMSYMDVQDQLALFYWMRFGSGVAVVIGALMFIYAILGPRAEAIPAVEGAFQPAE
jgi:nitric oxide reductase subunit B